MGSRGSSRKISGSHDPWVREGAGGLEGKPLEKFLYHDLFSLETPFLSIKIGAL